MSDTPVSLLERLRACPDPLSWKRLVDLYAPLIHGWLVRQGLSKEDVEDLSQEVLAVVVKELPAFQHSKRPGAFRHWLRTITINRLRGFWRTRQDRPAGVGGSDFLRSLNELEDLNSPLSRLWDQEHDQHVARRLVEMIRGDFEPATWQAFRRLVMDAVPARTVAAELGISVNAVLLAKSRVLRRLRQEIRGLLD